MHVPGWVEGNPLATHAIERLGFIDASIFKMSLAVVFGGALTVLKRESALGLLVLISFIPLILHHVWFMLL